MKYLLSLIFISLLIPLDGFAQFLFEDATVKSMVDQQAQHNENVGPGVIIFDLDGDGWDDVFMAGGENADKLYRNLGNGTFVDVADSNVSAHNNYRSFTRGGSAFDFNNDGLPDLYIICSNNDILWKNNGDGTFTNVSEKAGIISPLEQNESNGSSFGDFDGDGDNDLYVARWVDQTNFTHNPDGTNLGYAHRGFPNWLYVNNGDGTFSERAKEMGVDGDTGCSNIALFFDYDRDGDLDILVGNDFGVEEMPNRIFKNMLMETGKATFVDVTEETGLATKLFCMGIAPNDFNRDGQFDFYETTIGPEVLMQNKNGLFRDVSKEVNLPNGYMRYKKDTMTTTWTALMADYDNDGWEDAFVVHGFIGGLSPWVGTRHDTSVFLRNMGGFFQDYTDSMGFYIDFRGKGGAILDYDHDGKVDIIGASIGSLPGVKTRDFRVIHNITPSKNLGHWLQLKFTAKRTAKEAIGTISDTWAGGIIHSRQISTGGGMGSQNALTSYVGLGSSTKADSIIIYWPADKYRHRQIDRYYNVEADRLIHFTENVDSTKGSVAPKPTTESTIVYPTIAKNTINITHLKEGTSKRFEIYNLLGVREMEVTGSENNFSLAVGSLKSGFYVLRIYDGMKANVSQFIKE